MFRVSLALLACVVGIGCDGSDSQTSENVMMIENDDSEMAAGISKSRSSVQIFIAALKSPKPGQTAFTVKMPVKEGDQTEHMWLADVAYDGKNFTGKIDNEPEIVSNVKLGQAVTIAPSEISDWMYVENGKLVGGETIRVMRNKLSGAERSNFDKSVPFKFE